MKEWQIRVVDERIALQVKINALYSFLDGESFEMLDKEDKKLLEAQAKAMEAYSKCLESRIKRFK